MTCDIDTTSMTSDDIRDFISSVSSEKQTSIDGEWTLSQPAPTGFDTDLDVGVFFTFKSSITNC